MKQPHTYGQSGEVLIEFRGGDGLSRNQACYECTEQGFAASAHVVHELEEAKIEGLLICAEI